jgi:hypothetical protein
MNILLLTGYANVFSTKFIEELPCYFLCFFLVKMLDKSRRFVEKSNGTLRKLKDCTYYRRFLSSYVNNDLSGC